MCDLSFSECVLKTITNIQPVDVQEKCLYPHLTYCIHSLNEYLQLISSFPSCCEDACADEMIYRGMVNAGFDLKPSLVRLKHYNEDTEYEMVNEFLLTRPEAFVGLTSGFELLSKMQHYGLPTRLLDFTTNPLIALYFACEDAKSENSQDGRIVCHSAVLHSPHDKLVNTICSLAMKLDYTDHAFPLEHILAADYPLLDFIDKTTLAENFPIVAKPKYWNQRIINQSSIFLIYPDVIHDLFGQIAYYTQQYGNFEDARKCEDTPENRRKIEEILQVEKDSLGAPTFDLNHSRWNEIKKAYSIKYSAMQTNNKNPLLNDRFHFGNGILPVSQDAMNEKFVSILVDKESKLRILKELESIKIDLSFVYPELEYTARKIKRKYEEN